MTFIKALCKKLFPTAVKDESPKAHVTPQGMEKGTPEVKSESVSQGSVVSRYSLYVGQSNIVGAKLDQHGNPQGEQYDLARRDGFKGFKIVILNTYHLSYLPLQGAVRALEEKGFEITVISLNQQPYFDFNLHVNAKALRTLLGPRTQLWILSDSTNVLDAACADVVERFYRKGGGLYLWGDNAPFFAEANFLGERLFGVSMAGDYQGDQVLGVKKLGKLGGIIPGHPISTGIAHFYEGMTIAAIKTNKEVKPLVYSSDGNVVTAYSESGGCRLLVDGGFTRLYYKWDAAGTGRFVTNCAAWLANAENEGTNLSS